MCIHDLEDFHFGNARPIETAVGLARSLVVIRNKYQAIRMPDINGNLTGAVAGKFVGACLRQRAQDFQVVGRSELCQTEQAWIAL